MKLVIKGKTIVDIDSIKWGERIAVGIMILSCYYAFVGNEYKSDMGAILALLIFISTQATKVVRILEGKTNE